MRAKRTERPIVIFTRRYGGEFSATTSRLAAYARALAKAGADVVVLTRFPFVYEGRREDARHRGRLYLREEVDGVAVARLRIPGEAALQRWLDRLLHIGARIRGRRRPPVIGLELIDLLYGLLAFPLVCALRPSAVVAEQGPAWLALPLRVLPRFGIPLVLQVSDVKSVAMELGLYGDVGVEAVRRSRRNEDALYESASAIVTVTDAMLAYVVGRLGGDRRKVRLIPNGAEIETIGRIEPSEKHACKERLGVGGKFVVLYAGTLGAAHDLETLLAAAERLRSAEIAFLLVGQGPLERQLVASAARRRLDNVVFHAAVPLSRLRSFLAAADAGVSTEIGGLRDTVRSKSYLYMAGGLPIVVTDDGGEGRALVSRAGSGFLVPAADPGAIAARLLELKDDPRLAAALGDNGRRYVETHHDRAQLARQFADVVIGASRVRSDARFGVVVPEADGGPEQP